MKRLSGMFIAGLFAVLPLVVTIAIIGFLADKLNDILGPRSAFGKLFSVTVAQADGSIQEEFSTLGYLSSFVIVIMFILLVGFFAQRVTGKRIGGWVNHLISKVPFINKVYSSVEQVVSLVNQGDSDSVGALSNVVFARIANTRVIGMLSSADQIMIGDTPHYLIYFPSTPLPATGFNYLIPCCDVEDADVSVEELTKILLSLGSLGPGIMNKKSPLILSKKNLLVN